MNPLAIKAAALAESAALGASRSAAGVSREGASREGSSAFAGLLDGARQHRGGAVHLPARRADALTAEAAVSASASERREVEAKMRSPEAPASSGRHTGTHTGTQSSANPRAPRAAAAPAASPHEPGTEAPQPKPTTARSPRDEKRDAAQAAALARRADPREAAARDPLSPDRPAAELAVVVFEAATETPGVAADPAWPPFGDPAGLPPGAVLLPVPSPNEMNRGFWSATSQAPASTPEGEELSPATRSAASPAGLGRVDEGRTSQAGEASETGAAWAARFAAEAASTAVPAAASATVSKPTPTSTLIADETRRDDLSAAFGARHGAESNLSARLAMAGDTPADALRSASRVDRSEARAAFAPDAAVLSSLGVLSGPAAATPAPASLPLIGLAAPLGGPDFSQALGAQLATLARDGVHEAQLQLNPLEMGPVMVQIRLEGNLAQIDFTATQGPTRDVLEASWPALAASMNEAGFTLGGGGVFEQQPRERDGQGEAPNPGARRGEAESAGLSGSAGPLRPAQRTPRGLLDLYA